MRDYWEQKKEIERLFNAPKYRALKLSAFIIGCLDVAALLAVVILFDDISDQAKQIIKGCVGVGAIIFVVLVAILTYKVYSDYFRNRYNRPDK